MSRGIVAAPELVNCTSVKTGFRFTPNRMAPAWGLGSDCTRSSYPRTGPEGFCQRVARSEQSLQPTVSDHLFRSGSQRAVRDQPCPDSLEKGFLARSDTLPFSPLYSPE